jgi:hypothetical protein
MFCNGAAQDPTGKVVIWGGSDPPTVPGACASSFRITYYVPPSGGGVGTLVQGPNEQWDIGGSPSFTYRYYPTVTPSVTPAGDFRMLATDGWCYGAGPNPPFGNGNVPVLLDPAANAFTPLYTAEYNAAPPHNFNMDWYPQMYQLSNGKIVMAGSDYATTLETVRTLDVATQQWATVGSQGTFFVDSGAMFQKDKVIRAGVFGGILQRADVLNFAVDPPTITPAGPMPTGQTRGTDFYLVPAPDGRVVCVGGGITADGQLVPRLNALVWDPYVDSGPQQLGNWSVLAPMATPRMYHSEALLLPSGAIFVAGGQHHCCANPFEYQINSCCQSTPDVCPWAQLCDCQYSYQIYKPPYFFAATPEVSRPAIRDCAGPEVIHYGETFPITLTTNDAYSITKTRLIRPACATHSHDHNGRSMELAFSAASANTLCVTAPQGPPDDYSAPPGYYMLFVARDLPGVSDGTGGFPSEAHWVRLVQGISSSTSILDANPPLLNPYTMTGPFRDVLQTGPYPGPNTLAQGIGDPHVPGTPAEGPVQYNPITVTFSSALTLAADEIGVSCTSTGAPACNTPCPAIFNVAQSGSGGTVWNIYLTGPIPPGGCTQISFSGTAILQYQSLPGDADMSGASNTQDINALIQALNNGTGNLPQNLARYDIDRSGSVNTQDMSRLYQLLNGTSTTQVWSGIPIAACIACGTEGGGGDAPSGFGGDSAGGGGADGGCGLSSEEIAQIYSQTLAACAADGVDASECLQILDSVFGGNP